MKTIFLLFFLSCFAFVNYLKAECSDWHTHFYPSKNTLTPKGIIIFQGFGGANFIIRGLEKEYPIFLKSGNHKVKLKVKFVNEGYGTLQAVLEPVETLKIGETYELVIENYEPKDEYHTFTKYNTTNNKTEKPIWKIEENTKEKNNKNITTWENLPVVGEKNYEEFGCGPAIQVIFSAKIKSNSDYYIKATITNKKTNVAKTYLFDALNDKNPKGNIVIGHGMCSGSFGFGEEKEYSIVFDLVDLEGNSMKMETKAINFERPERKER